MSPRRFALGETALTINVVFSTEPDFSIDRERRSREARLLVLRALTPHAQIAPTEKEGKLLFYYSPSRKKLLLQIISELTEKIDRVFNEPLTPKMVDQYLKITARERLRWYKDGRLPNCGMGAHRRGKHRMQFPLFPIAAIDALVANPSIIDEWRRLDASIAPSFDNVGG
jgi:hypothetical protein